MWLFLLYIWFMSRIFQVFFGWKPLYFAQIFVEILWVLFLHNCLRLLGICSYAFCPFYWCHAYFLVKKHCILPQILWKYFFAWNFKRGLVWICSYAFCPFYWQCNSYFRYFLAEETLYFAPNFAKIFFCLKF